MKLLPTPKACDGEKGSPKQAFGTGSATLPSAVLSLLPTPRASDAGTYGRRCSPGFRPNLSQAVFDEQEATRTVWGRFAPAVLRWARVFGSPAPVPTITGRHGKPVLNPALVEWLMGVARGFVTAVPGLSRIQQLRVLGNGVVRHQAAAALRELLDEHQADTAARGVSPWLCARSTSN